MAIPATISSWATFNAGGRGVGSRSVSVCSASARRPIRTQPPELQIARMRGIDAVAVRVERRPRSVERLRRPAEVARDEGDLGLGDDASRTRHRLLRPEGARRTSQESLRTNEVAKLRHRDAAKRQRRGVITQGDALERAEGITRCECACRSRDQRVHRVPATLVTPAIRYPVLSLSHDEQAKSRQTGG